jgi:hypothetical protein
MTDDELTPSEKKALESLPKERVPSAFLEERVVRSLRREGLLQSHEGRRVIPVTGWRIAGAVAACVAFVVCGFALGYWASSRPAAVQQVLVPDAGATPVAYSVQRAGTDYILALERLAEYPDTAGRDAVRQGREVALATLYTAADQIVKMVPREILAQCIVHAIATADTTALETGTGTEQHRLIEF